MNKLKYGAAVVGSTLLAAGNAHAALGDTFVVDLAPVTLVAGAMITALAVVWVARKVVGFVSR